MENAVSGPKKRIFWLFSVLPPHPLAATHQLWAHPLTMGTTGVICVIFVGDVIYFYNNKTYSFFENTKYCHVSLCTPYCELYYTSQYYHSWLSAAERSQLDFSLSQSWSDLKPTEICDYITHISKSACSFIWLDTDKYQACVCVSGMWTQGWSPAVTVQERRAVWEELWFSELWVWTAAVDQTRTVHVPAYLCHHGLGPVLKVNTFKVPLCWP